MASSALAGPAFLCFFFVFASASKQGDGGPDVGHDLVRSSCVRASYPTICLRTLSNYTGPATKTPRDVALAAVNVSLSRARSVSAFLSGIKRSGGASSKRERGALRDCVDQISDSADELSQTLGELKRLGGGGAGSEFRWHMSNAETWVSAALTNEDTCLDGFQGVDDKVKDAVKRRITNVSKVTSNALYMINRLDKRTRASVVNP